jgi:hypothetical protein
MDLYLINLQLPVSCSSTIKNVNFLKLVIKRDLTKLFYTIINKKFEFSSIDLKLILVILKFVKNLFSIF